MRCASVAGWQSKSTLSEHSSVGMRCGYAPNSVMSHMVGHHGVQNLPQVTRQLVGGGACCRRGVRGHTQAARVDNVGDGGNSSRRGCHR